LLDAGVGVGAGRASVLRHRRFIVVIVRIAAVGRLSPPRCRDRLDREPMIAESGFCSPADAAVLLDLAEWPTVYCLPASGCFFLHPHSPLTGRIRCPSTTFRFCVCLPSVFHLLMWAHMNPVPNIYVCQAVVSRAGSEATYNPVCQMI